jgi:hypothetical protein
MIGVAIRPVWQCNGSRSRAADQLRSGPRVIRGAPDRTIRPAKIDPPQRAKHRTRSFRFGESLLNGAVTAHLTRREITQPDAEAERHMSSHGSSETNFNVVRVWPEYEEVDGFDHDLDDNGGMEETEETEDTV